MATETADLGSCLLLDSYHLHKGGSGFGGVRLLHGTALPVFHINDYPAEPARERIDDSDRVYPGDGVAPLGELIRTLDAIDFRGFLSVELFNPRVLEATAAGGRPPRAREDAGSSCASPSPGPEA